MTLEEIKRNKPDGATHYNPNGKSAIYYKVRNGAYAFYCAKHDLWYGSSYFLDDDNIKPL